MEYIHEKKWGESVRARIKSRMCTPGPGEVTEVEIRQAFDKGEEVSFVYQLVFDTLLD